MQSRQILNHKLRTFNLQQVINIQDENKTFVWDCLGRPLSFYEHFHMRLIKLYGRAPGRRQGMRADQSRQHLISHRLVQAVD